MENFDPKPQGVKEKNLYIVHLDIPRIIILSSVLVGIIIASFLFGMSFVNEDRFLTKNMDVDGISFDENKKIDVLNNGIPSLPSDGIDDSILNDNTSDFVENGSAQNSAEIKKDGIDVFTRENIKEIIPAAEKVVKKKKTTVKKDRIISREKTVKVDRKKLREKSANERSVRVDGTNKSRVREVSKEVNNHKKRQGYFLVQVASYDKISKAEKEKSLLKLKKFDAFIDRSIVNGKNFYRVRIGPLSSKKRALELLNDIQRDDRYANSYMVQE